MNDLCLSELWKIKSECTKRDGCGECPHCVRLVDKMVENTPLHVFACEYKKKFGISPLSWKLPFIEEENKNDDC